MIGNVAKSSAFAASATVAGLRIASSTAGNGGVEFAMA
jgi:hypothetical protein